MHFSDSAAESSISQFLSEDNLKAMPALVEATSKEALFAAADKIADIFGGRKAFEELAAQESETRNVKESKLISSFHNNLNLLVQKTWVEKSDETLKDQALFRLSKFCEACSNKEYETCYQDFLPLLQDVVYLMFGIQTRKQEFLEYALRIDPGFGTFWWYITNLPEVPAAKIENAEKERIFILLGMYFLANY
ncbi:MAG: hypothetical protein MJ196_10605 [Treponemataceae bacterium]|nr:hypothetical protein [Treponemataceae bacterium]